MDQIPFYVHPTAEVSPEAHVGAGTRVWRQAQIREHAQIGDTCNIGKGVYIDAHVRIGSCVKIQNHVSIFEGVTLEDGVFVGPHVCFTNDLLPRAITPDGQLKGADDWKITPTLVKYGASIWCDHWAICSYRCRRGRDARRSSTHARLWQPCPPTWVCLSLCSSPLACACP